MAYIFKGKNLGSFLALTTDYANDHHQYDDQSNLISIHWNRGHAPIQFLLDEIEMTLLPQQLITTTFLHTLKFPKDTKELTSFSFNREFYCIKDHDHEVSCNGILFFGTSENPILTLDEDKAKKFELLFLVFEDEFQTKDNIQEEMLEMLLKRLIIKLTRLARQQFIAENANDSQIDIIRKFNILVEQHFKQKHKVNDYADLLFKSPKTLSNLFLKLGQKSPLQIIHDRIALEGRRLLIYTDKTVKEIGYDLGFEDTSAFHKLFKKLVGCTPQEFKSSAKQDNSPS